MSNVITKKINRDWVDIDGVMHYEEGYEKIRVEDEPPFAKFYFSDIGRLFGLPSQVKDVLYFLVTRMGYGNGEIAVTAGTKRDICRYVGIYKKNSEQESVATVNNYLGLLIKKGLLKRKDTGVYLINPYVFGRGEWKDIKEIRSIVKYSNDKTIILIEKK